MPKEDLIELIKDKSTIQAAALVVTNPEWLDDPEVSGLLTDDPELLMQILKLICRKKQR